MELAKAYNPQEAQEKWLKFWNDQGYFHSKPDGREPFTIVIPPPNLTGALHMGHALNNTLQDVLIRWRRMQGFNALWMPGTDHAGIATQAVVERLICRPKEDAPRGPQRAGERITSGRTRRSPHPRPTASTRLLPRLAPRFTLDPISVRAGDVLQDVQGRPDLSRQAFGELGHAVANVGGDDDVHGGYEGGLDIQVSSEGHNRFIRFSTTPNHARRHRRVRSSVR